MANSPQLETRREVTTLFSIGRSTGQEVVKIRKSESCNSVAIRGKSDIPKYPRYLKSHTNSSYYQV